MSDSKGSYLSEHKVGVHTTDKFGVTRKTEFTVTVAHMSTHADHETILEAAQQAITDSCLEKFSNIPYSITHGEIFELLGSDIESTKKDKPHKPVQAFFMSKTFVQQY